MTGSLLFIDTETTGIVKGRPDPIEKPERWPRLVEIAWIRTDRDGNILSSHEMLVTPHGFEIPECSTAIHGITTEQAAEHGIPLIDAITSFHEAVKSVDTIIAHNLWFDAGVLAAEGARVGISPIPPDIRRVCTMLETMSFCKLPTRHGKGYKWPGLAELYQILFDSDLSVRHRAADDAKICMDCYFELMQRGFFRD